MNNNSTVSIMALPFQNCTKKHFIEEKVLPKIENDEKCFIVTANPEIIMETRDNNNYKRIVKSADFIVPDGIGIIYASQFKGEPLKERIAGFDLMMDFLHIANERGNKCYFLGGKPEVNKKMIKKIKCDFPNLKITGSHHGYFDINNEEIPKNIAKGKPDFIFVAMGFPRQEEWIYKYQHLFEKGVFMGVGGSFDVLSGSTRRAPDLWIKLHLEWLYRLLKEPTRWRRILPIFKFVLLTIFNRNEI